MALDETERNAQDNIDPKTVETGENEQEKAEVDEKELSLVKDILKALTKTVKAFTIYPPTNPIYHKFGSELNEKFNGFFQIQEAMTLKVEQFSLSYKGVEVLKSDDRNESIGLLLYVDGIREICFHKGLTLEEVKEFIDVLRLNPKEQNLDDDIVTLLWEKDLEHVSYFAPENIGEEELAIQEKILTQGVETKESTAGASSARIILNLSPSTFKVEPPAEEEFQALKEEFARFGGDKLLSEAFELFAELVSYRPDVKSYEYFMKKIGQLITIFIDKEEISMATEILKRLKQMREKASLPYYAASIDEVIYDAGRQDKVRKVLSGDRSPEEMSSYLLLLNPVSIPDLMAVLGYNEEMRKRKLLCNVIAIIGKKDIDAISKSLNDARWYLVRNTVMILGMIKDTYGIKYIQKVLKYPELRVRRETIWALNSMNHAATKEPLKSLLTDDDTNIRTYALKALKKIGGSEILETVKQIISGVDFRERPFAEKKAFLEALGELGKEDSFPILADYFTTKGLLRRKESAEMRACAAYGLGLIGTEEALSILEREKESKDDILSQACAKALRLRGTDG